MSRIHAPPVEGRFGADASDTLLCAAVYLGMFENRQMNASKLADYVRVPRSTMDLEELERVGRVERRGTITVAVAMSVWRAREAKTAATYGSARWATLTEIRAAGLTAPGRRQAKNAVIARDHRLSESKAARNAEHRSTSGPSASMSPPNASSTSLASIPVFWPSNASSIV
jgi:hypothetical protein